MTRRPRRAPRAARALVSLRALLTGLVTALVTALVTGLALVGVAVGLALPASAATVPSPSASPAVPAAPAVVSISDLRPRAPVPGGDLQLLGTIRNAGAQPLHDLQLRLRVAGRLATRSDLQRADSTPPIYRDPRAVLSFPDLAPGASAPFDLRAAVDDLRLGADGVYPVQLEVRGQRGTSASREQLGQVPTYLPWFGSTAVDPLRVAWLWPMVDQPRVTPTETLLDDELATSVTAKGRLGSSLAAARTGESGSCAPGAAPAEPPADTPSGTPSGPPAQLPVPSTCRPVPVTYAVDPDLLFTLQAMTRAYQVAAAGSAPAARPASAAATGWLTSLRAALSTGEVIALPYADPDVVALTRGSADLAADVAAARTYGVTVTREVLGHDPLQTVAFPPDGRLSDAALDAVTTSSTQAVVLGDDAVTAPAPAARSTPGARVALPSSTSGDVTGLVVDRGLSDLLVPARPQDARLAEQRWLVETAMIAAELPSRGRTIVVAAPRRGTVDPAVVGAEIADTGQVPWMCAVRLSSVAAGQESCPGAATPSYAPDRTAALAQPDARSPALTGEQVAQVGEVRADATQLTGAVVVGGTDQAQALRARLQRAELRAESSAWRDRRPDGLRMVELAQQEVSALRADVSVLTGRVLLTSNNGRVSVAVLNELDQAVTVALRLQAPATARLSRVQTEVLEVPARTSLPVQLDASTSTSGRFVVEAQLLDRDGAPFGQPKDLIVRSTRYGRVALAVTGLGVAVLLVAAGVQLARRALRRPVST